MTCHSKKPFVDNSGCFLKTEKKTEHDARFKARPGCGSFDFATFEDDDYNRYFPLDDGRYAVCDYGCIGAWRGIVELTAAEIAELKKL